MTATSLPTPAADGVRLPASRPDPTAQIERVFAHIHATRMQGLPFLNPALRVEAVGFHRRDGRWLGVLITPWFMNLILMPDRPDDWHHVRYGDTVSYPFPSGVFEFINAREAQLGDYQMCSLFSPVFEFADQDGARATAQAVLTALFDPNTHAGAEGPGTPMPQAQAEVAAPAVADPQAAQPQPGEVRPAERAPVSKRDFLRGRWRADAAESRDA